MTADVAVVSASRCSGVSKVFNAGPPNQVDALIDVDLTGRARASSCR